MKLLVFALILFSPYYLLAQESVKLGQSKDEIRALLNSNKKQVIKISEGDNGDTVIMGDGVIQSFIYYKNNICNSMKIIMLWVTKDAMEQQFINNSFTMSKEGVWINRKRKVRIDISEDKKRNTITMIETQID